MSIVGLRNLCSPAFVYLAISMIIVAIMYYQNYNNVDVYCLGSHQCDTLNIQMLFIVKILYIVFWTWILNIICSNGSTNIAWALVIVPFLLSFIFLTMFMLGM
jgi:hypothetical protein